MSAGPEDPPFFLCTFIWPSSRAFQCNKVTGFPHGFEAAPPFPCIASHGPPFLPSPHDLRRCRLKAGWRSLCFPATRPKTRPRNQVRFRARKVDRNTLWCLLLGPVSGPTKRGRPCVARPPWFRGHGVSALVWPAPAGGPAPLPAHAHDISLSTYCSSRKTGATHFLELPASSAYRLHSFVDTSPKKAVLKI